MIGTHKNAPCRPGPANSDGPDRTPVALPTWKRGLDLFCLLLAAPALIPIMAVIALGIRLSSRGSVLFRQERIGFRGRPFLCYKFRSMKQSAETQFHQAYLEKLISSDAPMAKLDAQDHRLSGFGALLQIGRAHV